MYNNPLFLLFTCINIYLKPLFLIQIIKFTSQLMLSYIFNLFVIIVMKRIVKSGFYSMMKQQFLIKKPYISALNGVK
ncbi:hypothetical protein BMT55_07435 [Listeria newyorkensis]|uniref:Uncharacterized protein n=1 Tax=Listeria newyorkensis TaxID=1497681 RepID=A0ABX4XNV6_9LIST|nr:hypothetical protein EP58_15385 [Listeria newyorkensis]PNP92781.1 hypothetical protein BMT55_07435 [Listeria newyorkensis]